MAKIRIVEMNNGLFAIQSKRWGSLFGWEYPDLCNCKSGTISSVHGIHTFKSLKDAKDSCKRMIYDHRRDGLSATLTGYDPLPVGPEKPIGVAKIIEETSVIGIGEIRDGILMLTATAILCVGVIVGVLIFAAS